MQEVDLIREQLQRLVSLSMWSNLLPVSSQCACASVIAVWQFEHVYMYILYVCTCTQCTLTPAYVYICIYVCTLHVYTTWFGL